MDDLLNEFLTETAENLSVLDIELVKLEQNPNDPQLLGNIFRIVHTIKGTCGFLNLPRLEAVAHAAENVLGRIREGELAVTPKTISIVLQALDAIKSILSILETTEAEPTGTDADLITALDRVAAGETGPDNSDPIVKKKPAEKLTTKEPPEAVSAEGGNPAVFAAANPPEFEANELPISIEDLLFPDSVAEDITASPKAVPVKSVPVKAVPVKADQKSVARAAAPAPPPATITHDETTSPRAKPIPKDAETAAVMQESAIAQQTIRVSVDLLENLMTMVSELVLTRNQLLQIGRLKKDTDFQVPLQRLSHVTSELQEGVMKTRMQPIGNAWAKLPRLIRDLSLELGKKIELEMIGAETELDRQVLELIKDPLTHMVRNSADHGIEAPIDRLAAGKQETGRIALNAYHEGGHIIIEIADDGRGLDLERIKAKVISNELVGAADLELMSEQQIQQFIFKAGFSTATKVTSVSGRGVGMDVVRTNIEKIGGTIELKSRFGLGSTFVIKIPLTLAIVSALIVNSCGERFAIPQISVVELVRVAANSEHRIERLNEAPVLRLRDRLLPLISLEKLLHLDRLAEHGQTETFIIVAQVGTHNFGIMVDKVFDTEEIVVKPVAPILRNLTLFSGNTILGDGSVIMILDPNGIAAASGELSVTNTRTQDRAHVREVEFDERAALLVFRAGQGGPKAVPLALVARLEEIELESIEYSDDRPMVQYRGRLMPLIPLEAGKKLAETGRQPVLVFADGDQAMGLIVDEIIDIVEDDVEIELSTDRAGFLGSAIISGHATDMIDAGYYLTLAFKDWFRSPGQQIAGKGKAGRRLLLVDDSVFFRNLLTPLLSVAGYAVTAVGHAEQALKLCEETETPFDIIVSDIEMPDMDGFDFARAMREGKHKHVPMVALSSHTQPENFKTAREAGFIDYVAKFDREGLLYSLNEILLVKGAA